MHREDRSDFWGSTMRKNSDYKPVENFNSTGNLTAKESLDSTFKKQVSVNIIGRAESDAAPFLRSNELLSMEIKDSYNSMRAPSATPPTLD